MISPPTPSARDALARCHRRSALIDAVEAVRGALNAKRGLTADPTRLTDTPGDGGAECTLRHHGNCYRLTLTREGA